MEVTFKELSEIDCAEHIEKRPQGKKELSYISWCDAWQLLKENCPDATYEHLPWQTLPSGEVMCYCSVTVGGVSHTAHLPVLDGFRPVVNPNAFEINKAMQRCFAKAIGMHGLGLYIYRGEDLPPSETMYELAMQHLEESEYEAAMWYMQLPEEDQGLVKKTAPQGKKTEIQNRLRDVVSAAHDVLDAAAMDINKYFSADDIPGVAQVWNELTVFEKGLVFARLGGEGQEKLNTLLNKGVAQEEATDVEGAE